MSWNHIQWLSTKLFDLEVGNKCECELMKSYHHKNLVNMCVSSGHIQEVIMVHQGLTTAWDNNIHRMTTTWLRHPLIFKDNDVYDYNTPYSKSQNFQVHVCNGGNRGFLFRRTLIVLFGTPILNFLEFLKKWKTLRWMVFSDWPPVNS